MAGPMQRHTQSVSAEIRSLRAEARLYALVGGVLLLIGFPLTIWLVIEAHAPEGLSPALPPLIGGPFILLGYAVCHYASMRLSKAKTLEKRRRSAQRRRAAPREAAS